MPTPARCGAGRNALPVRTGTPLARRNGWSRRSSSRRWNTPRSKARRASGSVRTGAVGGGLGRRRRPADQAVGIGLGAQPRVGRRPAPLVRPQERLGAAPLRFPRQAGLMRPLVILAGAPVRILRDRRGGRDGDRRDYRREREPRQSRREPDRPSPDPSADRGDPFAAALDIPPPVWGCTHPRELLSRPPIVPDIPPQRPIHLNRVSPRRCLSSSPAAKLSGRYHQDTLPRHSEQRAPARSGNGLRPGHWPPPGNGVCYADLIVDQQKRFERVVDSAARGAVGRFTLADCFRMPRRCLRSRRQPHRRNRRRQPRKRGVPVRQALQAGRTRRGAWRGSTWRTTSPSTSVSPRFFRMADGELRHVSDMFTDREIAASPTYNDFLVPTGSSNSLNIRMAGPDGLHIVGSLVRLGDAAGWTDERLGMIRRVLPHLRHFVRFRQALADAATGAVLSTAAALGARRVGVVIAGPAWPHRGGERPRAGAAARRRWSRGPGRLPARTPRGRRRHAGPSSRGGALAFQSPMPRVARCRFSVPGVPRSRCTSRRCSRNATPTSAQWAAAPPWC